MSLRARLERLERFGRVAIRTADEQRRRRLEGMTTAERVARLNELIAKAQASDAQAIQARLPDPPVSTATAERHARLVAILAAREGEGT